MPAAASLSWNSMVTGTPLILENRNTARNLAMYHIANEAASAGRAESRGPVLHTIGLPSRGGVKYISRCRQICLITIYSRLSIDLREN